MTALKHASLAGQDLSLLTERSVLLPRDGHWPYEDHSPVTFLRFYVDDLIVLAERPDESFFADRFTYLGEQSDDGWVLRPEGGWESNPVGDQRVQLRYDFGSHSADIGVIASEVRPWWWPRTIAFRLADLATREGDGYLIRPDEDPSEYKALVEKHKGSLADARTQSATGGAGVGDLTPWEMAADELCAAAIKRAEGPLRRLTEDLYENLLYEVQDYLRENTEFNLKGQLSMAERERAAAQAALRSLAESLGVYCGHLTPGQIAEQGVAAVDRLKAKATTASAVGTTPKAECVQ